jgi:hypothetical protein
MMISPNITIAGRDFPVPLLAPRQNRIVLPGLLSMDDTVEKHFDMLCEVVFAALTRAQPHLERDDFEAWPVATYELVEALPVIARQTGFLSRRMNAGLTAAGAGTLELPDWDAIIAQFCNFLPGTTPDYWEDALTAPRLEAMREEWRKHPPLAVLAAGWLGYRPKPRNSDALEELMRLFPTGRITAPLTLH